MYQGKYPEAGLPPGYNGTLYEHTAPPPHADPPREEKPEPPCRDIPGAGNCDIPRPPSAPPSTPPPCPPPAGGVQNVLKGISEHLFSHSIDMEDLLIIGLTVLLINSGADTSLIIAMAMLFVMGL